MCGISGFIDFAKRSDLQTLRHMTETLVRRGPDDSGLEFTEKSSYVVGLGHRRLSILDLSSLGHQPMTFEHLSIVYNGEVYNFQEIRNELETFGYVFQSASDTEVILKAFHRWGTGAVERFRGMFAFALYDRRDEIVYLFRDRAGVKPLYFYKKGPLFLFGSELKALMPHPGFEKMIDPGGLSSYLKLGYIPAPHTIYQHTHKLAPGHYLRFDLAKGTFESRKYWDIVDFYHDKSDCSEDEAVQRLEELLITSCNLRMVSDVPVGTFLSGGIDSSLVTALIQHHSSERIRTFTIGFEDERYNEAGHAKKIAEHLGTDHTEYYCTKKDVLEIIPLLPMMYDEPFADTSAIPTALVSRLAKADVSVVLSGDGGDEAFCGYPSYDLLDKRAKFIGKIPARNALVKLLATIPDPMFWPQRLHERSYRKYLKFKSILSTENTADMFRSSNAVFTRYDVNRMLLHPLLREEERYYGPLSPIEEMMISDFKSYLPDDLMTKVDRATMYVSLEGREPLLDHRLLEFAAALPLSYKRGKKILKQILSKYIPPDLFERKKQGFGLPINTWLRTDLKFLVEAYLDEKKIADQQIFDVRYVRALKKLFFQGRNDDDRIWTLLMFQMWYEQTFQDVEKSS